MEAGAPLPLSEKKKAAQGTAFVIIGPCGHQAAPRRDAVGRTARRSSSLIGRMSVAESMRSVWVFPEAVTNSTSKVFGACR